MTYQKSVLAVLNDLMFTAKIQDAAKRAEVGVLFATTAEDALEKARQNPALIILDLNTTALDAIQLIRTLKQDEATRGVQLVGFVSHVQTALRQTAQNEGCNEIIARSAFSQNLPSILRSGAEEQVKKPDRID